LESEETARRIKRKTGTGGRELTKTVGLKKKGRPKGEERERSCQGAKWGVGKPEQGAWDDGRQGKIRQTGRWKKTQVTSRTNQAPSGWGKKRRQKAGKKGGKNRGMVKLTSWQAQCKRPCTTFGQSAAVFN